MSDTSKALSLYANDKVILAGNELSSLESSVLKQIAHFRRGQPEMAQRVLLAGLGLRRIKASLSHGQWEPWLKRHAVPILGGAASRTIRNWMRLADCFVTVSKLSLPDFLALPGDQTELALSAEKDTNARRLMSRMAKFVGDLGPTELMIKHNVREAEPTKKARLLKNDSEESAEDAAAKHELTVQDRFNELTQSLRLSRADKAVWMSMGKQMQADLVAASKATYEHNHDLWVKTHGRNAK